MFSGDAADRRSDLLDIVSVLEVDTVLERAAAIGMDRTGARGVVVALVDERAPLEQPGASERLLLVHGTGADEASALRRRLGDGGLLGTPGARPEHDPTRLRDPATGREVLRVPVVVDGHLHADLLLLDVAGIAFAADAEEAVAVLGRVTGVAVRNALSYRLSERRREALELAAAVDASVRPPYLLSEPLERVAEGALRIAGARSAAVVRVGPDALEVAAASATATATGPEEVGRALAGTDDRLLAAQREAVEVVVRSGDHLVWAVPLAPEHAYAGVVVLLLEPDGPAPSADDRDLVAAFVRHCSLALDHAVLQQERHEVLAADRDRIARDLHDGVIQRLYATALKLRAGIRTGDDAAEHHHDAVREIGDSLRDIRGTVFELERGRSASLRGDVLALAREYEPVLGFAPVVHSRGPVDSLVPGPLGDQVVAVLREALSNTARHADASRAEVELAVEPGRLVLTVSDDGRGVTGAEAPGHGLRNLRSRATALGGDLEVGSGAGAGGRTGTVLRWRVPLDPAAVPAPE